MRNLKRALSLAMASVMTLGMMTVGASAKGIADFSDAAEITNVDAVAVTSDLGIFVGYDDGEFKGQNIVTRAQMAVICAKLLYGADVDPAQFTGISKFTDVPAWAEGWVNLCASLGIIVGRDETTFDPDATVSTVEASVMLAKTLGYFKNQKDFGSDWKLATTAKATQLGLYGDLKLAADAGLTRDSVAELVFNTMTKAVPVDYNELLGVYYNHNQGIVYALEFNYLETLGYKNFGLVYKTQENTFYGRPATTWGTGSYKYNLGATSDASTYDHLTAEGGLISKNVRMLDKDEIVTVAKKADYVFTKGTSEEDIYKALGAKVCNATTDVKYTWNFYINGEKVTGTEPSKTITSDYAFTGKGSVTEIYIDDYNETVDVCEINYYLGEVASVKEDEDGRYLNIKALSDEPKLDDRKFYTSEWEEEDLVVFTVDCDEDGDFYAYEMMDPTTVTGEVVTVQNKYNSDLTYIRLEDDSTKYEYTAKTHNVFDLNDTAKDVHPDLNEDYILYMTPAGYVLGFELAEEAVDKYLFVKDSDEELKDWVAKVVLTDGTTAKVDVKNALKGYNDAAATVGHTDFFDTDADGKADNIDFVTAMGGVKDETNLDDHIWKYSVADNGVYTLTYANTHYEDTVKINNGKAYIAKDNDKKAVLIGKDTIFVDMMNGKSYKGYTEVPNVEDAEIYYSVGKNNVAKVVYIVDGEIYDKDSTYFFLTTTKHETKKHDNEYYYYFEDSYVDGEPVRLLVNYDALDLNGIGGADEFQAGVMYKAVKTVDEKYITEVVLADDDVDATGDLTATTNGAFWVADDTNINELKFDISDETKFVTIESMYNKNGVFTKYVVSEGSEKDLFVGPNDEDKYCVVDVIDAGDDETADVVFVYIARPSGEGEPESQVPGYELILGTNDKVLTVGEKVKAIVKAQNYSKGTAFFKGNIYSIDVNGQTLTGYCFEDGYIVDDYTVQVEDITVDGTVAVVLKGVDVAKDSEGTVLTFDPAKTVNPNKGYTPEKFGNVEKFSEVEKINVVLGGFADDAYYSISADTVIAKIAVDGMMANDKAIDTDSSYTATITLSAKNKETLKKFAPVEVKDENGEVTVDNTYIDKNLFFGLDNTCDEDAVLTVTKKYFEDGKIIAKITVSFDGDDQTQSGVVIVK